MISEGYVSFPDLRRIAFFCVTILGISVLVLIGRFAILSARHLQHAEWAEESGQFEEAIEAYTGSIRNYFPGNPYSARAIQGALRIIDRYHEQGKIEPRKSALLDLRASLLSIHSFYQPYGEEFRFIERELQVLP
jgi:hypothetical protein